MCNRVQRSSYLSESASSGWEWIQPPKLRQSRCRQGQLKDRSLLIAVGCVERVPKNLPKTQKQNRETVNTCIALTKENNKQILKLRNNLSSNASSAVLSKSLCKSVSIIEWRSTALAAGFRIQKKCIRIGTEALFVAAIVTDERTKMNLTAKPYCYWLA